MPTLRLVVEYEGTDFSGFVTQTVPPGVRTIQAELEAALRSLTGEAIRIRYASRTDAGVHARGQVIAFEVVRDDIPTVGYARGLTSKLPEAIVIRRAELAPEGFDPRREARGKRYRYRWWNDPQPSALERRTAWWVREPLDVEAMHAAAQAWLGEHDFSSFRASGCDAKHAVRRMHGFEVRRLDDARVELEVIGNAFVKNMVRIFAGTLRDVGRGRLTVADARRVLEARDRAATGMTAPPGGLCLEEVIYDDRLPPKRGREGT